MEFVDNSAIVSDNYNISDVTNSLKLPGHDSSTLDEYLSRPRVVRQLTWIQGARLASIFNPLRDLCNIPAVKNKLSNYHLMNFTLCLRVVMNGQSFQMGRLGFAHIPLPDFSASAFTTIPGSLNGDAIENQRHSQYPGTRASPLSPSDSTVYELKAPFFAPVTHLNVRNVVNGTGKTWEVQYSEAWIDSLTILDVANAAVGTSCSVTVFAWLEDVDLIIPVAVPLSNELPLVQLVGNNDDNEDAPNGLVSSISSAFASATGQLKGVPVIGSYMSSATDFLNKTTKTARIWGYSRPAIKTDPGYFRSNNVSAIAPTSGNETVEKLTLDPKQGLTIDPSAHGLPPADSMSIEFITRHWSYIGTTTWTVGQAPGSAICGLGVNPMSSITSNGLSTMSSLTLGALPFQYWSGSIEYKFIFVTSKFHRGRMAIAYNAAAGDVSFAEIGDSYSTIIDIAETTEITLSVSYCQGVPYLLTSTTFADFFNPIGPVIYNSEIFNGSLTLRVVNELVSPSGVGVIDVLVYHRAGEDFEVQAPKSSLLSQVMTNPVDLPALEEGEPFATSLLLDEGLPFACSKELSGDIVYIAGKPNPNTDLKPTMFFGEKPVSFRSLLKRYQYFRQFTTENIAAIVGSNWLRIDIGGFPCTFNSNANSNQYSFNNGNISLVNTHLMSVLRGAYVGWKGGIRWKAILNEEGATSRYPVMRASRRHGIPTSFPYDTATYSGDTRGGTSSNWGIQGDTWPGASITSIQDRHTLEFEVPYYNQLSFSGTNYGGILPKPGFELGDNAEQMSSSLYLSGINTTTSLDLAVDLYCATGEDFDLLWYVGPSQFIIKP